VEDDDEEEEEEEEEDKGASNKGAEAKIELDGRKEEGSSFDFEAEDDKEEAEEEAEVEASLSFKNWATSSRGFSSPL
jgi:hypothetical protein